MEDERRMSESVLYRCCIYTEAMPNTDSSTIPEYSMVYSINGSDTKYKIQGSVRTRRRK